MDVIDDGVAVGGVGSVNARSEVALFTEILAERPDSYVCNRDIIALAKGGRVLHRARYGSLTVEKANSAPGLRHFELDASGRPKHVSILTKGGRP